MVVWLLIIESSQYAQLHENTEWMYPRVYITSHVLDY